MWPKSQRDSRPVQSSRPLLSYPYVEPLNDARMPLTFIFCLLLVTVIRN